MLDSSIYLAASSWRVRQSSSLASSSAGFGVLTPSLAAGLDLCHWQGHFSAAPYAVGNLCRTGFRFIFHRPSTFCTSGSLKSSQEYCSTPEVESLPLSRLRGYSDLTSFLCSLTALQPLACGMVSNTVCFFFFLSFLIKLWLEKSPPGRLTVGDLGWKQQQQKRLFYLWFYHSRKKIPKNTI